MQYKYRVIGIVKQPFILRGAYFIKGSTIDFCITQNEFEFVKERCNLEKVIELANENNSVQNKAQNSVSTAQNGTADKSIKPTPETPSKRKYTRHKDIADKKE